MSPNSTRGRVPGSPTAKQGEWIASQRHAAQFIEGKDGNSFVADVDRGGDVWLRRAVIRMAGIEAPSPSGMRQKQGERARDELIRRAREASKRGDLWVRVLEQDRFGRLLSLVYDREDEINAGFIRDGLAEPADNAKIREHK